MAKISLAVFYLIIYFGSTSFAEEPSFQKIAINFDSEESESQWQAKALEKASEKFISGFGKLQVVDHEPEVQTDYLWKGRLFGNSLDYEILALDTETVVNSGHLRLNNEMSQIQIQALSAVKPLVRNGGFIDRHFAKAEGKRLEPPELLVNVMPEKYQPLSMSLLALIGGLMWGWLVFTLFGFVFGSLHGLERIWHWNIKQYAHSWLEVTLFKLFGLFLLLLPVVVLSKWWADQLAISSQLRDFLLTPFLLILSVFLFRLANLYLTRSLDKTFLRCKLEKNKIWDITTRRYFMGYYKRLGLDIPMAVLKRIVFVPGKTPEFLTYGGGFTKVRVVVPFEVLDLAIGDPEGLSFYNEDEEYWPSAQFEPVARVLPRKWAAGISKKPKEKKIDVWLDRWMDDEVAQSDPAPLESAAGAWGYLRPHPDGDSVGLISNNMQDLEVVKELLSEHHMNFAKIQFDEEFDDTDPTDLDFLFGALLVEIGKVHRNEAPALGAWLKLSSSQKRFPIWAQEALNYLFDLYYSNFSKHITVIQDAYAVFQHGRHHLAQYLHYLLSGDDVLLSSRASNQNLFSYSLTIFTIFGELQPTGEDLRKNRATLKNRAIWLSKYFSYELPEYQYKKRKPILSMTLASLALVTIGLEIYRSTKYSEHYSQLRKETFEKIEKYELEEAKKKEKEDGRGQ